MKNLKELFAGFGSKTKEKEAQSCCGGKGQAHHHESISQAKMSYQCPMKCEGNKTYDAPGHCPVCNMRLAPVGEKQSHH